MYIDIILLMSVCVFNYTHVSDVARWRNKIGAAGRETFLTRSSRSHSDPAADRHVRIIIIILCCVHFAFARVPICVPVVVVITYISYCTHALLNPTVE